MQFEPSGSLSSARVRLGRWPLLRRIGRLDGGNRHLTLDIVHKPTGQVGFSVLPWRWIVERTFAWLTDYRRLARDYEIIPSTAEAWIRITMIHLTLRKLT